MEEKKEYNELQAQLRLAEVLNDKPRKIKLGAREFEIKALRPGAQHLIAEQAAKIAKNDESFSDIIKQFAVNVPAVIRCLCIAILNDKDKINGDEYKALYDYIEWETDSKEWLGVLVEVLQMLNLDFFFYISAQIDLFREMTLRKKTKTEALSSKQPQK
jgi:hypothetical protein